MKIVKVDIDKLKFPGYNPRKKLTPEDKTYKKIKASIEKFGYVDLVIVNKDFTIIGGNQRVQILKDLGFEEIDVIQLELNKKEEKALNIALNKIQGTWDEEKLNILLTDLKTSLKDDFFMTGFNDKEVQKLQKKFEKIKNDPEIESNFEPVKRTKTVKNIKCPNCSHEWNE
jgi:ParB-like chromosome segregation protein Spo0J